jgi:Fe-S cluster biogenesis protein NfuA
MSEEKTASPNEAGAYKIVRVQPTPNPDAFQFIVNGKVMGDGTKTFDSPDDVGDDPLAKALFEIFGIQSVYLKQNFVTITKSNTVGWHTLMEETGHTLEEHLSFYEKGDEAEHVTNVHPILENFNKEDFFTYDSERQAEVVNALLDVAIRPALANDGGGINILSIEGKQIKIHYQGACGSCPSSTTGTLQYIEQFLKEAISPDLEVQAN